jgi:hypothetical protein
MKTDISEDHKKQLTIGLDLGDKSSAAPAESSNTQLAPGT